jgi:cytochrome c oxidase subunit 2
MIDAVRISPLLLAACLLTACSREPPMAATAGDRGLEVANASGCTACHSLDGARGIGPSWRGIYGETVTFTDGRTAVVDDAYLRRSMLEPGADIVEGYQNVMVPAAVTDAQIADIIALIGGLRRNPLNDRQQ